MRGYALPSDSTAARDRNQPWRRPTCRRVIDANTVERRDGSAEIRNARRVDGSDLPLRGPVASRLRTLEDASDVFRDGVGRNEPHLGREVVPARQLSLFDGCSGSKRRLHRERSTRLDVFEDEPFAFFGHGAALRLVESRGSFPGSARNGRRY
jgi:hypothetical protein